MELQLSHHWTVPKSPSISVLQHRLSHCFLYAESLPVEFPTYDWSVIVGATPASTLQQSIQEVCDEWSRECPKVVVGEPHFFNAVGRSWYVASQRLYVEQDISETELRTALAAYFHQTQL